jgi:SMI1/KNR4 family protein SUKH-1
MNPMSINLPSLLERFRVFQDFDNDIASYRTLVPWVGPEAYLNIIYRAAPSQLLLAIAEKLRFPAPVFEFLSRYNGANLFSGALNLYGVVEPGRLLNRSDSFSLPPYNIEAANKSWSVEPQQLLVIGVYQFDGSQVCIDRSSGRILFFKRKQTTAELSWTNFEHWLREEISRMSSLFDSDGRRLRPESPTVPHKTTD